MLLLAFAIALCVLIFIYWLKIKKRHKPDIPLEDIDGKIFKCARSTPVAGHTDHALLPNNPW